MKASHRSALSAAGLAAALAVSAIPSVLGAQMRPQAPGPDTKRAVVTTFRGDPDAGVRLANEIRNRIQSDFNIRQLMPVSKKDIDNTLVASGYRPDSALSPNDIKELAKLVRGDEVIDGEIRKSGAGYRVNARLFMPRDVALSQPLISVESANLGDVARQIVREYDNARKQIPAVQECENHLRGQKVDAAAAAARKAMGSYPRATIARLCLANAYQSWKSGPDSNSKPWKDSVLSVTNAITTIDPASTMALRLQYGVYEAQKDDAKQMQTLIRLMGADPTNVALREQVVATLVSSGKADQAVPIIDSLVKANPGDPQYMRTRWLVLRAANRWKDAIAAGQAYVAADPTAADSGYYLRLVSDYASDSAFGKAAETAAQAIAKYPRNAQLYLLKAQNERKAGQLDAAIASLRKGLELDPKAPGANLLLAQMNVDTGKLDDAVAAVKADVAADPTNKERNAQFLLGLGSTAYRAGVASKNPADFQKAIKLLQASDEINPSANAKFFTAVSAWQVLAPSLQQGRNWKCADVRAAEANLTLVSSNMPGGGSVSPEAAGQIMSAVPQAQQYIDAQTKRLCK
ncbi:MAG TPA: tetratricopeptide repeat protein [Conexibacter sp.]|nr:tetratricopeptide repeat protein [Conexibacter sp.]